VSVAKSHLVAVDVAFGQRLLANVGGPKRWTHEMPQGYYSLQPRPCTLLIHASLKIIIIITCVSAGFHRPTKKKTTKKIKAETHFYVIVWQCAHPSPVSACTLRFASTDPNSGLDPDPDIDIDL